MLVLEEVLIPFKCFTQSIEGRITNLNHVQYLVPVKQLRLDAHRLEY